ncbi:fumarylacetoacetate hydrolase family protein [Natronospora cellulosivora (SeqCode)]
MKILRYKYNNEVNYGKLNGDNINRINGDIFGDYEITKEEISLDKVQIISPLDAKNVVAIGLNYRNHVKESGHDMPEKPAIFLKATSSIVGEKENIVLPAMAPNEVDFEAELAIIIAKKAKNLREEEAKDYILGYTCANDVSARDCQRRIDKQWARGKSFDTFCPLGPVIETKLDPDNCNIKSLLNGEVMQDSNTSDMIFDVSYLVSYISKNMTLLPGTVIITGTPEGVGFARKPAVFLKDGDIIEIEIEGIGKLSNKVIKE